MNYLEPIQETLETYQIAFDRCLQLQEKREKLKKCDWEYWSLVDKIEKAQTRCRHLDAQLRDYLYKIKPSIYEQK